MCFFVHDLFSEPITIGINNNHIPIRKVAQVIITRAKDAVEVKFRSPYQKQVYRTLYVKRKDVREMKTDMYPFYIVLPKVKMGSPDDFDSIDEGYHSYVAHRTTLIRGLDVEDADKQRSFYISTHIPLSGIIPSKAQFYYDPIYAEYVSDHIAIGLDKDAAIMVSNYDKTLFYVVRAVDYIALLAYVSLYGRTTKWYDKKLHAMAMEYAAES